MLSRLVTLPKSKMNKGAKAYQQVQLETSVNGASPLELIIMLYNSAIDHIKKAAECSKANKIEEKAKHVDRAMLIVQTGLMGHIDQDKGKEIAESLTNLYICVTSELLKASIHNDQEKFERCVDILENLLKGWTDILDNNILNHKPSEANAVGATAG